MIDQSMVDSVVKLAAARLRLIEERAVSNGTECFEEEGAVLGALGIEIGLKALIYEARGIDCFSEGPRLFDRKDRHNIKALFGMLDLSQQQAILQGINSQGPRKWGLVTRAESEEDALQIYAYWFSRDRTLEEMLEGCSHTFEQFRYSYEKSNIFALTTFIGSMLDAIVDVLRQRQREQGQPLS